MTVTTMISEKTRPLTVMVTATATTARWLAGAALLASFLLPASTTAQPASYQDGVLTIPHLAMPGAEPSYHSDVTLQIEADGRTSVIDSQQNPLVSVESLSVSILESLPVQVRVLVSGNLSVPCVELLPAAISLDGNNFTVLLAESVLGPAESCITVLEPFETSIDLETVDLPAGDYSVTVNGVSADFEL